MNDITADFVLGRDIERQSSEVDMDALIAALKSGELRIPVNRERHTIIEGHLSHLLPVDLIIVLRTSTRVLEERLAPRGYPAEKLRENMEAEVLGVITIEAIETGIPVYEIDTTGITPEEAAQKLIKIVEDLEAAPGKGRGISLREMIDFTGEIMEWY